MKLDVHDKWYPSSDKARLAYLAEECSEVIKCCMKMLRFGIEESWQGVPEKARLQNEIADLKQAIEFIEESILNVRK